MQKFSIFANGDIREYDLPLPSSQIVIAADGGARHCMRLGIIPQIIIGDFDSLSSEEISFFTGEGVLLLKYPSQKDETDLELALDYALSQNASEVILYGILGGRWDMSFANILLLASPKYTHISFQVIERNTNAYLLHAGETLKLTEEPGTLVSTIPLQGPASGITYQGLKWRMENDSLPFGSPRGVSNLMIDSEAQISLKEGILLVFVNEYADI